MKSLPGPVVTMAGNDDHLGIVFSVYGSLQYWLLNMDTSKFISQGMLPISPGSQLTWLGFAWNLNNLASFDSKGVGRMLRSKDRSWMPIVKASKQTKGKRDTVWPIYMTADNLMCHICKGGKKYPQTLPRPVPTAMPICLPLLGLKSESEKLQERHARQKMVLEEQSLQGLAITAKDKVKLDKLVLLNLKLACKSGRSVRALDLSTRLLRKKSLDTAIVMANHLNQTQLVERMSILLQGKEIAQARASATKSSFSAPATRSTPNTKKTFSATPQPKSQSSVKARRTIVNKTPTPTAKNPFAKIQKENEKASTKNIFS